LDKESLIIIITKIQEHIKQIREITQRSNMGNWGFPFIAGFILFLLIAVILSKIQMVSYLAEPIADVAYFALVIGVVLQLVFLGKNRKKEDSGIHGSG
jgi:uncharacterized membrane protein YadS